jgi:Fic family protein
MNASDFTQPAGALVNETWDDQTYLAYVPQPLPPAFGYDPALVNTLGEAVHKLGELAGLGRLIPNLNLLVNPFKRQEAVLSSRIEGTQTDILGLYAYEAEQLSLFGQEETLPPNNDAREVFNYLQALNYGLHVLEKKPLTLNLLREMHAILFNGVRGGRAAPGEFRRVQNYISGDASGLSAARFVPPPPRELMTSLDAFEKYIHAESEHPPLVRLAWLHYQFEAIHPFIDGNGRIGRLLITLLLIDWKLLPAPLLYLSAFFEKHRSLYYDLLLDVSRRSAWREWTLFFLQAVATQAEAAALAARRLLAIQQDWRQRAQTTGLTKTAVRVLEMLFETPFISARIIMDRCGVSQPTASSTINRLKEDGYLSDMRAGSRSGWYVAVDLLPKEL